MTTMTTPDTDIWEMRGTTWLAVAAHVTRL